NGVGRRGEGGAGVPDTFQMANQRAHRIQEEPREPLLLGGNPRLIQAGQELPLVELHAFGQMLGPLQGAARLRRCLEGQLEIGYIRGDGSRIQTDVEAVGADNGSLRYSRRLELVAEGGEGDGEAVSQRRRVTLGPEQLDEDLAGVRL